MPDNSPYYPQVVALLNEGVAPEKLARVFDLPIEHIEALPAARHITAINPEDIPAEVAKVISVVIDEAHNIIQNGTPAMKLRLIQSIFGKAMMQLRNQSPKAMEDLRAQMDTLTQGIIDSDPYTED